MASPNVLVFNDLNFETDVLKAKEPVLVDFTATWCGPCKQLSPIVDAVAEELVGKVRVGKLDIDDAPQIASKLGIRSVPTLMVFKNGERAATQVGMTTKAKILAMLQG
ncbi:MAG TPA: thioredoxin [Polyangiaceae bacterium]|nr:thioredoxin [Polyangiaceae bacterium]